MVPGAQVGSEEDMNDVLTMFASWQLGSSLKLTQDQKITEDHDSGVGFKKVEWRGT